MIRRVLRFLSWYFCTSPCSYGELIYVVKVSLNSRLSAAFCSLRRSGHAGAYWIKLSAASNRVVSALLIEVFGECYGTSCLIRHSWYSDAPEFKIPTRGIMGLKIARQRTSPTVTPSSTIPSLSTVLLVILVVARTAPRFHVRSRRRLPCLHALGALQERASALVPRCLCYECMLVGEAFKARRHGC